VKALRIHARRSTVVTTKMELLELLSKAEGGDVDWLREGCGSWPRR